MQFNLWFIGEKTLWQIDRLQNAQPAQWLRNYKLKYKLDISYPLDWPKVKYLTVPTVGEKVEQGVMSQAPGGACKPVQSI